MADWYILSDIPYQKDFPPLIRITREPGTFPWHIKTDIPYMPEFPALQAISDKPHTWYINTDIPYMKGFPVLEAVNSEPGIKSWYIKDDIPYMKEFPKLFKINASPLLPWYILNDIPYQKPFPELVAINAKPSSGWYILDDIPYMKVYPPLMPISAVPALGWYILNDIPYMKEFPPLIPIDDKPIVGWYILNDIPYMKEFPPLYAIKPIPLPHYMYYFTVGTAAVGRWQVRKTRLNGEMPPPEEWTLIEDLGPPTAVLSACIEADGDFDYIAGNDSITLTTTDTPWMAVITTTKKLYVKQVCADIETAILLDTGVEQASLCRGWKSDKYSVDSGLICAYRKSNGVYAKVYKKVNGEYVWETLPQLLYEPVEHVEVKRLNDYRIGVYVTNPNRLLLSERFYIGGTSKTEYIHPAVKSWGQVCAFRTTTETYTAFTILSADIEDNTTIRIHGNYPFSDFDPDLTDITFSDDYKYSSMIGRSIDNGDLLIFVDKPRLNVWTMWRVVINAVNHIRYQITPQLRFLIEGQTITIGGYTNNDHLNVSLLSDISVVKTIMKQDLMHEAAPEIVHTAVTSDISTFTTIQKQDLTYTCKTESVYVTLSSDISEFTMTQSGDLPI